MANHLYLDDVFPKNLAKLIGTLLKNGMGYHIIIPDMLNKVRQSVIWSEFLIFAEANDAIMAVYVEARFDPNIKGNI